MNYDVIVVGGGHAGCEAAAAAAITGAVTLLITHRFNGVGELSCNCSMGGIGKGIVIREVDALGGLMGIASDKSGLHFSMLNRKKGAAVQGPRAQVDRMLYPRIMQNMIKNYTGLCVENAAVDNLIIECGNRVCGVITEDGKAIKAHSVVIATGTFLGGVMHIGSESYPAGRRGDRPSIALADFMKNNFKIGRMRTGTPPRIDGSTIDYEVCGKIYGDDPASPFSFMHDGVQDRPNIACHITCTNPQTHAVLRANRPLSALENNDWHGVRSPRYCQSIEDKINKFPDKDGHRIFLEQESLETSVVYPSGITNYLPVEIQRKMVNTIEGLEKANILLPGYLIEYCFVDSGELNCNLETKKIKNLFLAGQINGTTGYEEAAGQGLVAGVNAALAAGGSNDHFILTRSDSYIGVMIDDLSRAELNEPYRLFTSRAEYRLLLRSDNADLRLTAKGYKYGLVSCERYRKMQKKQKAIDELRLFLQSVKMSATEIADMGVSSAVDGVTKRVYDLFAYNDFDKSKLINLLPEVLEFNPIVVEQIAIEAKYAPYIARQLKDIELYEASFHVKIPRNFDYAKVAGLTKAARERLNAICPATIKDASVITEVTPAALMSIVMHIRNGKHNVPHGTMV